MKAAILDGIRIGLTQDSRSAEFSGPLQWLDDPKTKPMIVHPTRGRMPFVARDYQRAILERWDAPRRLIVKARQIGITQTLALEAYWKAAHAGRPLVLNVSRNEDQAKQFIRYAREAAENDGMRLTRDNELELEFGNRCRLKAQAATRSAGRGFPASDVYLDELAFAPWAHSIYQSIDPTVSTGGTLTVFSTPKGRANLFYLLWSGGLGGSEDWERWSFPWRVLWDEDWAEKKRRTMTREAFAEEYEAADGFLDSGDAVFSQEDVDACWRPGAAAGPTAGHEYRLSCDPAGSGADATVLQVWDVTHLPYRLMAQERWTTGKFERLYQAAVHLAERYLCEWARIDRTGLGEPVVEELQARLEALPTPCKVEPFVFTARSKEAGLTALQMLVESHGMWFEDEQLRSELLMYQRDDSGLVQDCVMTALMMADQTRGAGVVEDVTGY